MLLRKPRRVAFELVKQVLQVDSVASQSVQPQKASVLGTQAVVALSWAAHSVMQGPSVVEFWRGRRIPW